MKYRELEKKIFQLKPNEINNIEKFKGVMLDLSLSPFHVDTEKYYHLSKNKYYLSVHERYKPVQLHTHATSEINYVYSGQIIQWIDGKRYELNKGDVVVLDKLVPHAIETTTQNDILINLQMFESFFSGSFINQFTQESLVASTFFSLIQKREQKNYLIFKTKENPLIRQTIQNMLIEHKKMSIASYEMIKAYMTIFFGELLRTPEYYINKELLDYKGNYYIPDVLIYLEENYVHGSLNEVADNFSISPIHLTRLLKKYTGKTYKQLVHEKRVSIAYQLLLTTDLQVYKIAEIIGYSNQNIFNKKFKETYGVLPGKIKR